MSLLSSAVNSPKDINLARVSSIQTQTPVMAKTTTTIMMMMMMMMMIIIIIADLCAYLRRCRRLRLYSVDSQHFVWISDFSIGDDNHDVDSVSGL